MKDIHREYLEIGKEKKRAFEVERLVRVGAINSLRK